jgi:hypothetical protein
MIQIGYLEQWPVVEEECKDTLVEATEALKASTLRLPVTSGAHVSGKQNNLLDFQLPHESSLLFLGYTDTTIA